MTRLRFPLTVALLVAVATACGGSGGDPIISNVRVGQPTGPNAALYLTATGDGVADHLVGATTPVASAVELHQNVMDPDGTMRMEPAQDLELAGDGTLVLEPGGYHLMLVDVDQLEVGDTVEVTIIWETAGEMTVEAEVVDPADTMEHDH